MKIKVKLLATYRDRLPPGTQGPTCELEVPDDTTLEQILARFDIAYDKTNVILINGLTPTPGQPLNEGDEIVAFSAVAGG